MNRHYIILAKVRDLNTIAPFDRVIYAESNSPNDKPRLSGRPEVLDFVKQLLEYLPPTYTKKDALGLVQDAVKQVYL